MHVTVIVSTTQEAEAKAGREAKAKLVAMDGERQGLAALALKEASDVISQLPVALQLRYLQTLSSIAAENNSTIVFPVPLDLLGVLAGRNTD